MSAADRLDAGPGKARRRTLPCATAQAHVRHDFHVLRPAVDAAEPAGPKIDVEAELVAITTLLRSVSSASPTNSSLTNGP
jgi:hypothetical protein